MDKLLKALEIAEQRHAAKRGHDLTKIDSQINAVPISPETFSSVNHYSEMRANFLTHCSGKPIKTILIAGANRGAGASTASFNFAALLAQDSQFKVLLIDGNLRNPTLQNYFNFNSTHGACITDVMDNKFRALDFIPYRHANLHLVPSLKECANPVGLFESQSFERFLTVARERYDFVLIDGPPILTFPDGLLLSKKADGVILIIEAGYTRRWVARRVKKQIEAIGGKLLSVVLNKRKYYIPDWLYRYL